MINYCEGNLLESKDQALVNTVNTVGIMGKGIALQFRKQFPENYKAYHKACKEGSVSIGKMFVTEELAVGGKKLIVNFPTKIDWRKPSDYQYVEEGLIALFQLIRERGIESISLPPLGAGNGGLDWNRVKSLIEKHLSDLDCQVNVYQPNYTVQEALKAERVKLTPARAMLLSVLFEVVRNGEFVSEFTAEKVAYFLQRFGATSIFNLDFQPNFYGPYSGKVKHVLYYLNGSYISGFSAKDKKPFDEIGIMLDSEIDVSMYLKRPEHAEYERIVKNTKEFLAGFYSTFGLELLSTVDFIINKKEAQSVDDVRSYLENWNDRKKTLFNNYKFINVAVQKSYQISS